MGAIKEACNARNKVTIEDKQASEFYAEAVAGVAPALSRFRFPLFGLSLTIGGPSLTVDGASASDLAFPDFPLLLLRDSCTFPSFFSTTSSLGVAVSAVPPVVGVAAVAIDAAALASASRLACFIACLSAICSLVGFGG